MSSDRKTFEDYLDLDAQGKVVLKLDESTGNNDRSIVRRIYENMAQPDQTFELEEFERYTKEVLDRRVVNDGHIQVADPGDASKGFKLSMDNTAYIHALGSVRTHAALLELDNEPEKDRMAKRLRGLDYIHQKIKGYSLSHVLEGARMGVPGIKGKKTPWGLIHDLPPEAEMVLVEETQEPGEIEEVLLTAAVMLLDEKRRSKNK